MALIAGNPVARRTIKVCWEVPDQGRNYGSCDKCVRTRPQFMAVGIPAPECFDTPSDPGCMSSLSATHIYNLAIILEHAERRGLRDVWVALLRDRVTELSTQIPSERPTHPGVVTGQGAPHAVTSRPESVAFEAPRSQAWRTPPGDVDGYRRWLRESDLWPGASTASSAPAPGLPPGQPLLAIVMLPIGVGASSTVREMPRSLLHQTYPHWEAWLPSGAVVDLTDKRFRVLCERADVNGARWLQRAIRVATGDYLIFVPQDARLAPHALMEMARAIMASERTDLIYSDEDALDDAGARMGPRFKPAWDPELMLGRDVAGYPAALRTERVRDLLGSNNAPGTESAEAFLYDLSLRIAASAGAPPAHHIPRVLLSLPLETREARALDPSVGRKVVTDHLAREGRDGVSVVPCDRAPAWNRLVWPIPASAPRATVIVPTRNQVTMLARCVEGVLERTDYPEIELLVVDNGSDDPEALSLIRQLERDARVRILRHEAGFNFSELNNLAAREASGEVLVLLNDDTEVIGGGWLRELVSQALRPEVGVVGARLLYPDGRVQHAGIILQDGKPHHQFRLSDSAETGPYGELVLTRSVSAVTGACLALRKSVFEEVGGLDETLAVSFGDVDLCLRVSERGYRIICTPFAELNHHESTTRGYEDTPEKRERMARELEVLRGRWGTRLHTDRHANQNLLYTWDEAGSWGLPRPAKRRLTRRHTAWIARTRPAVLARRCLGRLQAKATAVVPNPLFSSAWYVAAYPEVASYRLGPYRHYRRHGVTEGRKPNPVFDTRWYLERYPDVAASGMDPLDHYLRHGASEGRDPSPDFSTHEYLEAHPEARRAGDNPILHWLQHGGA